MAKGDWRPHKLKFAAVALSTLAGLFLFINMSLMQSTHNCDIKEMWCLTWAIFGLIRNIALVLFHVSVGRDAIILRHRDRRVDCSGLVKRT